MKFPKYIIALALAVSLGCGDDDTDTDSKQIPDETAEEPDEIAGAAVCEAEVRDYSTVEGRFPYAGEEGFYRLNDTFCPTTDSILMDVEATEDDHIEGAKVIISPHAGWQYSGIATAEAFARVDIPDLVILVGNNHSKSGEPYAVYEDGTWAIPTGDVPVDAEIAQQLIDDVDVMVADKEAHADEHSNEMQVMWLHRFNPNVRVVPIAIGRERDLDKMKTVAEQLGDSLKKIEEPYLVVATTDLSHFEDSETTKEQDDAMIAPMLDLDPDGLFNLVEPDRGTYNMCGFEPTTISLQLARELGAQNSELVMQLDSSVQSGNPDRVVGYASIVFH